MEEHNLYLLALSLTKGLGPVSVKNMIAYCGSAKKVFETPKGRLARAPGIGPHAIQLLENSSALPRAQQEVEFCEKQGIEVLSYLHPAYPNALKYIHNAPLILFKKGNANLNDQLNIAIVGTRKATSYGLRLTEEFASFFAEQGINVVSGLAYGIDIAAHRAVLRCGGITTAVLGHGLDTIYPGSHRAKAWDMLEKGAWLSEYLAGTKVEAAHFPARNRIVSGICKAVVVIEAASSGGALITAQFAFEQNRQVYALPGRVGDVWSEGCNGLIRDNVARLVTRPEDILEDLKIQWKQHEDRSEQLQLALKAPELALSADEAQVLNVLSQGDAVIDQIGQHTGIHMQTLNPLLLAMEFKELVKQLPGKRYRKI